MKYSYKKLFILNLAIISSSIISYGTENDSTIIKERRIFIQTGYSHLRMLDKQVTPLIYMANIVPVSLGYLSESEKRIIDCNLDLAFGNNNSKDYKSRTFEVDLPTNEGGSEKMIYKCESSPIIEQGFKIGYFRSINRNTSKLNYFLGASLKETFYLGFTTVPIFVMNDLSISPSLVIKCNFEKTILKSGISFPLTGLIVRLPYSMDPADGKHGEFISTYTTGTRFFSPLTYQRVDLNFEYDTKLSRRWSFGLLYNFCWLHYTEFRGLTSYNNNFSFKFSRTLKTR